jgi:hypothetical protein
MYDEESINKRLTKVIEMIGKTIDILEECAEEMEYDGQEMIDLADDLGTIHESLLDR